MPTNPAMKKLQQEQKFLPEAKQIIIEFLNLHKTIDWFFGCEVRTKTHLFVPVLSMMMNLLHLNSTDSQEAYARQYQRTLFNWDAAEPTKVQEATKKTLKCV